VRVQAPAPHVGRCLRVHVGERSPPSHGRRRRRMSRIWGLGSEV
jgi:hypothetical protein